jgi:hypothetical protein
VSDLSSENSTENLAGFLRVIETVSLLIETVSLLVSAFAQERPRLDGFTVQPAVDPANFLIYTVT